MIILRAEFDPICKKHIEFAKKNHVEGFYIKNWNYHKEKMVKLVVKGFDKFKLVDFFDEEDIILDYEESDEVKEGYFHDLTSNVKNYILQNGLYMEDIMNSYNHGRRAKHVLSMTSLALDIARWHHVDVNKVYVCAMIHDIAKQMDKEEARKMMETHFMEHIHEDEALYHQYLGAYFLKHTMEINDKDMINAIMYHTTGVCTNNIAMIIFIADKLDPGRGYDITRQIKVVKQNLKQGFQLVKKEQEYYITQVEGKQIGTFTNHL